MFSFFGSMFGNKEAGNKIIDGVKDGIDKIWYTDEEKAEDVAQARREGYAVYMEWLKSTSGSRLARRYIAVIITTPWAIAQVLSMILDMVTPFIKGVETVKTIIDGKLTEQLVLKSDKFVEASNSLSADANANNELVGVVLLFYFGGPVAIEGITGLVNKWTEKKRDA